MQIMEAPEGSAVVNPMEVDEAAGAKLPPQPPLSTPPSTMTSTTPAEVIQSSSDIQLRLKRYLEKRKSDGSEKPASNISNKNLDTTYTAIFNSRINNLKCHDLNGKDGGKVVANVGSFHNGTDIGSATFTVRSNYLTKQNISYSFDPRDLTCLSCSEGHKVAGSDHPDRAVFVLSDQCFPPVVRPVVGSGCMRVIRIENGSLMELAHTFVGLMTGVDIAVGSIVLLASATHLANVGTAGYAEDFAGCVRMLLKTFSNRIEVKHGVPILLGGCLSGKVVRCLAEIDAWLASLQENENFPVAARRASLLALRNAGSGSQPNYEVRIRMPATLASHDRITWNSSGWDDIPATVQPISSVSAKDIVDTLISDINTVFSLNLVSEISIEAKTSGVQPEVNRGPATIAIVGSSNAGRLSNLLLDGVEAHYVQVPSTRPNSVTISRALEQLDSINFADPSRSLIVIFNLDCAAFFAVTEEGDMAPPRNVEGHYHLDGEMAVATKEMFIKTLKVCTPLFKFKPEVKKLILAPLPRYWLDKCCDDSSHIPNFSNENYEKNLFDGLSNLRQHVKDYLFLHHLPNARVISPFLVFADAMGRAPSAEAILAVKDLWGPDPVHPSLECLEKLATFIADYTNPEANKEDDPQPSSSTASHHSQHKRLRWAAEDPAAFVSPNNSHPRSNLYGQARGWTHPGRGPRGHRGHGGRGGRSRGPHQRRY
jgi:hypothetical protein